MTSPAQNRVHSSAWTWLCLALLLAGLTVSGYLLYRSLALASKAEPGADICADFFGAGCDETLSDKTSWALGIPLAGWGVVYYVTLIALLFLALALREEFAPQALLAAFVASLAGLANSVVLAAGMLRGWMPLCPLCLVLHAVNLLLVPVLAAANGRGPRQIVAALGSGVAYVLGRRSEQPARDAWRVVGFLCAALVAVVSYQWIYIEAAVRQQSPAEPAPDEVLEEFLAASASAMPIDDRDPQRGSAQARAVLVVFSDFQCPHCGRLASALDDLHQRYGNDLRIVFKHFPLSTDCNGQVKSNLHPRSCPLAWGAEAAHRQGKFWEFHDAAFAKKSSFSEEDIQKLASQSGLDLRQFDADRNSPAIKEKVADDVRAGAALKVRGTPTLFLNGRPVPDLSLESLEILLEHELHPR